MKIAVLSDIHGNIAALDAVLADAESRHVDVTVNLGDICSGALWPAETADRLMALGWPTIRGNHERQVLTFPPERMGLSDRYAADTLTSDHLDWFASLPETLRLTDDVLLVHGTPDSDLVYFLETVEPEGLRPATEDEISDRAGPADASLILCGHSHLQRAVQLADGRLVVNPGSVGLPAYDDIHPFPHKVENHTPHARYAVAERRKGGWDVSMHLVAYDWEQAARDAREHGREDWSRALLTGRV